MDTDVRSVHLAATGQVMPGPARLRGVFGVGNGTAGSILLSDHPTGAGLTRFFLNVPASSTQPIAFPFQTNGIRFTLGVYAVLTNVTGVTFLLDGLGPINEQLAFWSGVGAENNSEYLAIL